MPSPIFITKRGEKMPIYTRDELNAMSREELKQAYKSVRRNLLRNVNKMEKEGATFDMDMRPDIPKKITPGSISKLQQYNDPSYRAKHATIIDKLTGKIQSWTDHIKEKRSQAARAGARKRKNKAKKPNKTPYISIVGNKVRWLYEGVMANVAPSSCSKHEATATKLMWDNLVDSAVSSGNSDALNDYLQEYQSLIMGFLDVMYYESDREEVQIAFSELANYFSVAMDQIYDAIDAAQFQQYSGGWSVYDNNL